MVVDGVPWVGWNKVADRGLGSADCGGWWLMVAHSGWWSRMECGWLMVVDGVQ
jgi:hypothetical protein